MPNHPSINNPVIVFDGVCNLCNGFVNLLIRIDKKKLLRFLPLQSPKHHQVAGHIKNMDGFPGDLSTVVLVEGHKISLKSNAVIRISGYLPWPWRGLTFFRFLPLKFRDWLYDFIAANRYKWFGKKKQCMVPSPEIMDRFL